MRQIPKAILAASLVLATVWPPRAEATAPAASGMDKNGHLLSVPFAAPDGFGYVRLQHGVQFRIGGVTKSVIFYGPDTVRVNANLGENYWTSPSIVVVGKPARVAFELEDRADKLTIKSARLRIAANAPGTRPVSCAPCRPPRNIRTRMPATPGEAVRAESSQRQAFLRR